MKFLLIVRQKKNVDTFETVIHRLLAEGHGVTLAVQERLEAGGRASLASRFHEKGFALVSTPEGRGDAWRSGAPLLRATRDWAQYLRPPYAGAAKLRMMGRKDAVAKRGASSVRV